MSEDQPVNEQPDQPFFDGWNAALELAAFQLEHEFVQALAKIRCPALLFICGE